MNLKAMVLAAAVTALAIVLPPVFHVAGLGNKFLPLLLPLLLGGFLLPARWAVLAGVAAPVLSCLLTGMPPLYPPVVLMLAAEGAVLGGVAAVLYGGGRRPVWAAQVPAILLGRATALAVAWMLAQALSLPPALASFAMIVQGAPGVLLQLAVVPLAVSQIRKRPGLLFEHESQA